MIVSDFEYIDDLHLVRYKKMVKDENGDGALFVVSRPYACYFRLDGGPQYFTVPAGTMTNGASIPKIVPRWIVQSVGRHFDAAVIHDYLVQEFGDKSKRFWTPRVTADIFNEAMKAAHVNPLLRGLMYRAVLHFGPQWDHPATS